MRTNIVIGKSSDIDCFWNDIGPLLLHPLTQQELNNESIHNGENTYWFVAKQQKLWWDFPQFISQN